MAQKLIYNETMHTVVNTVRKDAKDFVMLSPQVKFLLVVQFIILFILSILIGIIFSPKFKKNVTQKNNIVLENAEKAAQVKLALVPQSKFMKPGEEIPFFVTMSGTPAYAVDIVLNYDPQYLQISAVENGDIYDRVIVNKGTKGMMTFSAAYDSGKSTFKKEGIVLKFKTKALKKTQETIIHFDRDLTIAAQEGENILKTAEPAQIHIFD